MLWSRIYDYLTSNEQLEVTNVSSVAKENLDLFSNTAADWVMTSRSSLEYLKTLPLEGKVDMRFMRIIMIEKLLNKADLLTNNFVKIQSLQTNLLDYSRFMTDFVKNFFSKKYLKKHFLVCKDCL